MNLILIVLVLFLLFGGGGYWGLAHPGFRGVGCRSGDQGTDERGEQLFASLRAL